jgi:hypothetical protein
MGVTRKLSRDEIAAYDAPFPDASYKAGACQFPTLVPITPQHASVAENQAAWRVLSWTHGPHRYERTAPDTLVLELEYTQMNSSNVDIPYSPSIHPQEQLNT